MSRKLTDSENLAIKMMGAVFEAADACRRENNALRSILRKQGLSDPAIQSRVRRILKKGEDDELAAQLLKRVCEESLKHIQEFDLAEWLQKVELKGPHQ